MHQLKAKIKLLCKREVRVVSLLQAESAGELAKLIADTKEVVDEETSNFFGGGQGKGTIGGGRGLFGAETARPFLALPDGGATSEGACMSTLWQNRGGVERIEEAEKRERLLDDMERASAIANVDSALALAPRNTAALWYTSTREGQNAWQFLVLPDNIIHLQTFRTTSIHLQTFSP